MKTENHLQKESLSIKKSFHYKKSSVHHQFTISYFSKDSHHHIHTPLISLKKILFHVLKKKFVLHHYNILKYYALAHHPMLL